MLDAFLKVASAHDTRTTEYQGLVSDLKMLPYAELRALADGKSKLASMWGDNEDWLDKFHGSPFYEHALGIQQQDLEQQIQSEQRRLAEQEERPEKDMARDEEFKAQDRIRLQKRILELELNKWKLQSSGAHVPGEGTEPQPQQHQSVTELPKLEPQGEQPAGPTMAGIKQAGMSRAITQHMFSSNGNPAYYTAHGSTPTEASFATSQIDDRLRGRSLAKDIAKGARGSSLRAALARGAAAVRGAGKHVSGVAERAVEASKPLARKAMVEMMKKFKHASVTEEAILNMRKQAMNMAAEYAKRVAQAATKQKILPGATGGSFAERLLKDRAGTLASSAQSVAEKYAPKAMSPNELPVSKYLGGRPALTMAQAPKYAAAFAKAAAAMGLKKEGADFLGAAKGLYNVAKKGLAAGGGLTGQGLQNAVGGVGKYMGALAQKSPGVAAGLAAVPVAAGVGAGYLGSRALGG